MSSSTVISDSSKRHDSQDKSNPFRKVHVSTREIRKLMTQPPPPPIMTSGGSSVTLLAKYVSLSFGLPSVHAAADSMNAAINCPTVSNQAKQQCFEEKVCVWHATWAVTRPAPDNCTQTSSRQKDWQPFNVPPDQLWMLLSQWSEEWFTSEYIHATKTSSVSGRDSGACSCIAGLQPQQAVSTLLLHYMPNIFYVLDRHSSTKVALHLCRSASNANGCPGSASVLPKVDGPHTSCVKPASHSFPDSAAGKNCLMHLAFATRRGVQATGNNPTAHITKSSALPYYRRWRQHVAVPRHHQLNMNAYRCHFQLSSSSIQIRPSLFLLDWVVIELYLLSIIMPIVLDLLKSVSTGREGLESWYDTATSCDN